MSVRLAAQEGYEVEIARVEHALSREGERVARVPPGKEADLELVAGELLPAFPDRRVAAVLGLAEPRDGLVDGSGASTLNDLPEGGRVALHGQLRREMLGVHRGDLRAVEVARPEEAARMLQAGDAEAWIAPVRTIRGAGMGDRITELLEPTSWATEAGRGTLVLIARDATVADAVGLSALDDGAARAAFEAEWAVLDALGDEAGDAVGVMARPHGPLLRLRALLPRADGRRLIRAERSGRLSDAAALGRDVAGLLHQRGAEWVLAAGR